MVEEDGWGRRREREGGRSEEELLNRGKKYKRINWSGGVCRCDWLYLMDVCVSGELRLESARRELALVGGHTVEEKERVGLFYTFIRKHTHD